MVQMRREKRVAANDDISMMMPQIDGANNVEIDAAAVVSIRSK